MTEQSQPIQPDSPDKDQKKNTIGSFFSSPLFTMILVVGIGVFIFKDLNRFWNILVVLLGFGSVIFIHELGHFLAAKSVGILVENFAIGMGPIVAGVKRINKGYRIRLLPKMGAPEDSKEGRGILSFVLPAAREAQGDTEYQLRLLPLGGFVKMLGQDDMGPEQACEDPRSFTNKGFWQRVWVISAGVIMNLISGGILFIAVFAHGVGLPPAVIGDVALESPAAKAGLLPGDKVIAINDETKKMMTFNELMMAAAFADKGQSVKLTVERPDGSVKDFSIIPQKNKEIGIQMLGIAQASSLTIAKPREKEALAAMNALGFRPGDIIVAVDGKSISRGDQLFETLAAKPGQVDRQQITVSLQRSNAAGQPQAVDITLPMVLRLTAAGNILGLIPRLQVNDVLPDSPAEQAGLQPGDVIVQVGSIFSPNSEEFSNYVKEHGGKPVELKVLRAGLTAEPLAVTLVPQFNTPSLRERLQGIAPKPMIGVAYSAGDLNSTVVADCAKPQAAPEQADSTANPDNPAPAAPAPGINLPRGACIVAIAGQPVSTYRDIIRQLQQNSGKETAITWTAYGESEIQTTTITVPQDDKWIGAVVVADLDKLDLPLLLKPLEEQFKGSSLTENLQMGMQSSWTFIAQTYVMIKGMITGTVSPKAASGPVGILKMSYTIASERPLTYYFYFMAMISMCIAVFNFLPLPIVDGGLVVLLIIEKIKGSPISVRVQEIITYSGLALLGGFALFVTFYDVIKIINGQL